MYEYASPSPTTSNRCPYHHYNHALTSHSKYYVNLYSMYKCSSINKLCIYIWVGELKNGERYWVGT